MITSASHHAQRAAVAMRLVPGEFNRRFIDRVMQGARAEGAELDPDPAAQDIDALATRVGALAATVAHVRRHHLELELQMPRFGAPLRALVAHAFTGWDRIGIAFSSTGLDLVADDRLQAVLSAMGASELNEVGIVLRELEWRIGELERTMQIRSELFSPTDARRVQELIDETRQPMLPASMAAAAA